MRVFVSYSRRDSDFVHRLDRDLTARGYDVWIDTQDVIGSGHDHWRRSVVAGIRDCAAMVVVLSPNSVVSESVERELNVAAHNDKRVIPIVLRECQLPDGFQYELAGVQHIDFARSPYERALDELVTQLGPPVPVPAADEPAGRPATVAAPPTRVARTAPRRPALVVAGGAVLVAAAAGVVVLLARDSTDPAPGALAGPTTPDTTPAVARAEVEQPVRDWADATTRRNVAEVARLNPEDTAIAAGFEQFYDDPEDRVEMVEIVPYVESVEPDGDEWLVVGATFARDRVGAGSGRRTNLTCHAWRVDLAAGTATTVRWNGIGPIADTWLPESTFAEEYERCTE